MWHQRFLSCPPWGREGVRKSIACVSAHLGCHFVAAEHVVQEAVTGLVADATDVHDSLGAAAVRDTEGASSSPLPRALRC